MLPAMVSTRHQIVGVPYQPAIANLFPEAVTMDFKGQNVILVPHKPAETFWLRRLGYEVPAPILTHYDFPHPPGEPPFDVQKKTCALMTMEPRCYVLNDMGTGKTRASLWSWDYLNRAGQAKRLLVVTTKSNLENTWGKEVFQTLPAKRYAILHHSNRQKRIDRLQSQDAEVFIINHDGVGLIGKEILERGDIDTLVIDELAVYRNGGAERTKYMRQFVKSFKWVWGLTGSPTPRAPTDVWAQATIITPHTVPKYFGPFRSQLMLKRPNSNFVWLPKPNATEMAFNVLQPAVRFTLDEVTELPELVERWVDVPMGAIQDKLYKDMFRHAKVSVQNNHITAVNAGAIMMKLLQISLGWLYGQDRKVIQLDNQARIDALLDYVDAANNKVLVFSPFKHALAGVSDALSKDGVDHATVSGDTSLNERSEIFRLFQKTNKYKVINAHPLCLAHGLTLTAADTIIWNGPVTSLETYIQANARIRRVGQKNKQLVLHLQSSPVEKKIYKLLQSNQDVQNKLLQMFEEASENTVY